MSDGLEIPDGEFYHIQINGSEALFQEEAEAIEYLKQQKDEIDTDDPDVQLAKVETGDEWAIEGLAWQNIAIQLL